MAKPIRATILESGVGQNRFEVFQKVIERYNDAMNQRFYLEAITLVESLIADRLESRLGELSAIDIEFENLGPLSKELLRIETDTEIKDLVGIKVRDWTKERNKAIHQAAKIEQGNPKDFSIFLAEAEIVAKDGMTIFRELDKLIRKNRP